MKKLKTKVVHKNKEEYDVYIGRPTKWGNPFSHKDGTLAKFKVNTRKEAIDAYRLMMLESKDKLDELEELRGKTLGCWCHPLPCHGDIIVELLGQKRLF